MKLPKFRRGDAKPTGEDVTKKAPPQRKPASPSTETKPVKPGKAKRARPEKAKPVSVKRSTLDSTKKARPVSSKRSKLDSTKRSKPDSTRKARPVSSEKAKPVSSRKAEPRRTKKAEPARAKGIEPVRPRSSKRERKPKLLRLRRKAGDSRVAKPEAERPPRKRSAPAKKTAAATTQARKAGAALSDTFKEGAEETRGRTRAATPGAAQGALKILGVIFGIFFDVLGFVLNILIAVGAVIAGPGRRLAHGLRSVIEALSRLLTPARVLALVVLGATVLLALSQYADYQGVSIGTDQYAKVDTVAPAPEISREPTGEAHSYVFVPVAGVCLLLLAGALRGRWRLCRLIALAGVAAIVVGLLIDRSTGQDPGQAALEFEGVKATLLGGFYAQLFAGLVLALSSLMLGRELRLQGAAAGAKTAPRPDRKRRRLGIARRSSGTEGARA